MCIREFLIERGAFSERDLEALAELRRRHGHHCIKLDPREWCQVCDVEVVDCECASKPEEKSRD